MIRLLSPLFPALLFSLFAFSSASHGQDFDYGDMELTAPERYDKALRLLYGIDGETKNRMGAMSQLKKAAAQDFAPAHNILGLLHLEGNGLFTSPRKALHSFEAAADLGDALGAYNSGYSYLVGRGTRHDLDKAASYFQRVVDAKNATNLSPEDFGTVRNARAQAYLLLSFIYDDDSYSRHDEEKAVQMLLKANELNQPRAAMLLAIRYAKGEGVGQDQQRSLELLERYKLASVNELHNSFNPVLFQGMHRESLREAVKSLVTLYEDEMSEQIVKMQTNFGMTLLDDEKLYDPEQAFTWLRPVATPDNPAACARLANLYYLGLGTSQDHAAARELYESAYRRSSLACFNLAVMLAQGQGGPADPERAEKLCEQAANDSWYPAIYHKGKLEKAQIYSAKAALELVKEKADQVDPDALYCLGRRTLFGFGVERNYTVAKNMIQRAADLGNVQARFFYGVYIANDTRLLWEATEEDKAIQAAADSGYPPAIHYQGKKAESSSRYNLALERYQQAAALEHLPAINKLGEFYRDGHAVPVDYAQAVSYFRQAAEQEDAIGTLNLGMAYEFGLGVESDPAEAYRLYQKADEYGSLYASYCIGNVLASGKLGQAAWEEAIPYWEEAGDNKVSDALLQIGDCYREGKGVEKNLTLAMAYYSRSNELFYYGDDDTNYRLAQLHLDPKSELYNPNRGLSLLRNLEISGSYPLAGYQLGILNMEGRGLKQNPKKAYAKFLRAAQEIGAPLKRGLGADFDRYYNSETVKLSSAPITSYSEEFTRDGAYDACFQIARILLKGDLIRKTSPEDGIVWLQIAAEGNHAEAQLELGKRLVKGQNVAPNPEAGWQWILKSARRLDEARYLAASQYFDGNYEPLGREKAIELLKQAAADGHLPSLNLLKEQGESLDGTDSKPATIPGKEKRGEDDGFDSPIDLDLA
ncbi:hypothetical protein [Pelagicoccus sp. SDUM812003]|uniref:tetratricopeptide repeat protein n=1 Tax=Pelagicoccus sp. SDUM812003 TaxID=3041267 RepID=UPI00280DB561|nr:hypothetical protein [Pelagicoccus sp. SDUM812003]MDQ8202417.1 hypothetical protein [Pelagicoccus sp. SDUM812003]